MKNTPADIAIIDLFCGVGGLTHGFIREGLDVIAGIDSDNLCKFAYERNNKSIFINKSIEDVSAEEVKRLYPDGAIRVLAGCAPCQPFSMYNRKKNKDDRKWGLLYEFLRLIHEVRPEIVSMENVPQIQKQKVFSDFVEGLERDGYRVSFQIVNAADYGVPQNRKRLILLASRLGDIKLIEKINTPNNYATVRAAIQHLEPISSGETSRKDPLHRASRLGARNMKRMVRTPAGGSWKDWDKRLRLKCHKKKTGKTFGSVYGRMEWDKPSPTMTTLCTGYGNGRFGHPEQHRAISLREAALLQTFPMEYEFVEDYSGYSAKKVAMHIGNAVPVELGRAIAESIKNHIRLLWT